MPSAAGDNKTKASFAIAADFRSRIARGDLREGQPLPVESDLVAELGVSKGVVREALRILEMEGLVEVRRGLGGGPRVRHPSIPQVAKSMGVYLQIGDVLVTDVWEVRDRLIGGAIERLAAEPDRHDLSPMVDAVAALEEVVGEFEAFYPQLLDVGEETVRAAGSATEHVIVLSLRHVIAAELAAATEAMVEIGRQAAVDQAVAAERHVVDDWSEVVRQVRASRVRAARQAYERHAEGLRIGLWDQMKDVTVGEAVLAPAVRHSRR